MPAPTAEEALTVGAVLLGGAARGAGSPRAVEMACVNSGKAAFIMSVGLAFAVDIGV
jgi:hypothetical protein